jgi:S-adenosylmethionine hydrolase
MKGVIGRISPDVPILDLTHDITPQSILEGALFVAGAMPYFAPGTVHVVVVDPGVGSHRRAVAVRAGGQVFVCPDNGLLTLFLRRHEVEEARVLTEKRFMLDSVSATFHGRDVFAPIAAHVARGVPLSKLGPEAGPLVSLALPEPTVTPEGRLRGEVIHVDRFGNLITNVPMGNIGGFRKVYVAGRRLASIQRTYSDVSAGCVLALVGSSGYLEVAVNVGNAAEKLGAGVGTPVEIGPK